MGRKKPTTADIRIAFSQAITDDPDPSELPALFDEWLGAVEREAAAKARGEALAEAVQAHRNLHKVYGSTAVCRGGIGGQALTPHCAEICYNADAHEKEMEVWRQLEGEAVAYSSARAAEIREGK